MKTSKVLLIVLINLFFTGFAFSCGYIDFTNPYYNLFDPNLILPGKYSPVFFTTNSYSNLWFDPSYMQKDNTDEWMNYLGSSDYADVNDLVYNLAKKDFEDAVKDRYQGNNKSLINLIKNKKSEIINYILFSKKCEAYSNFDPWEGKPKDNGEKDLINEAKKMLSTIVDPFLKLRYAFQAVKLLHIYYSPEECIKIYDDYIDKENSKSIIKYWALDHKAGALMSIGKKAEGLYLFSRIFDECPGRRYSSFYSFKVESGYDWNQMLRLCKNNSEKITCYFLRAINPSSVAIDDIKTIYDLNPNSDYLAILVTRELNKMEVELLPNLDKSKKSKSIKENFQLDNYADDVKKFVNFVLAEKKTNNAVFWTLLSGYLDFLSKDYDNAKNKITNISTDNHGYKKQINIIIAAIEISKLYQINDGEENRIMQLALAANPENFSSSELKRFMIDNFYFLYPDRDIFKKKACNNYSFDELRINPDLSTINNLIDLTNKKQKTVFENFILINFTASSDEDIITKEKILKESKFGYLKNYSLDIKATLLFLDNKIEEAVKNYPSNAELPDELKGNKYIDPYIYTINDDVNAENKNDKYMSKINFFIKILDLKKRIAESPNDTESLFLLGNAYYNITYFGRSWDMVSYYRSSASYTGFVDLNPALNYYQKALDSAKDRELKAIIYYLCAKCEQDNFDMTYNIENWSTGKYKKSPEDSEFIANEKAKKEKGFRKNFEILKKNYSNTKFFKEITDSCEYFKYYIN